MDDKATLELMHLRGRITRRQLLVGMGMLAAGLSMASVLAACGTPSGTTSSVPKRGGTFRLGVTGGGAKDMMDGQNITTKPDQAPIRGKQGITFHDGKTLGADDVIYSLTRMLTDPTLFGNAGLGSVDVKGLTKMDDRTVRLKLKGPDSTIGDQLGQYYNGIVPVGYKRYPSTQNGTGPYKLDSFTPGQQSSHSRNPNYWRTGQPYFDKVTIIDFTDPAAQVNALLGGQLDAITDIPFGQVTVVKAHSDLTVLESPGGGWLPLCMAIDMPPFTDVKVRQAFRLIADRQAIVTQVLSGHGRVANDLYSPFDACFASDLPQRQHDDGPAHHRRRRRHGRHRERFCAAGEGRGRDIERQERSQLLWQPVPEARVLSRPLGHAQLLAPGRQRKHPSRSLQRMPLAAGGFELPQPLPTGKGRGRPDQALPDPPRHAEARVRPWRLHHPVLQRPGRRVQQQGVRLQGQQGNPQPRLVRTWLQDHLVRLTLSSRR